MLESKYSVFSLGEVGVEVHDCEHKTPDEADDGYPYISIPDIQDGRLQLDDVQLISEEDYMEWTRRTNPQAGDVIVTRRGRVGDSAVVPEGLECALGQNLVILRSESDQVRQDFLRWIVRSPYFEREAQKHQNEGAVFSSLNVGDFPKFEIPVPPLPVQRRIADILGALDDKIELNRRMNETLEEMAQTLYRHWFVDFGPFQDQGFKDTEEVGPIPGEWEVTTVGDTTHINLGQSPKSEYYNEEGDGLVFHQGVSTYGWRFPVHERYCSKEKRVADDGDILISVRAPVGRLNIADRKLIIGRGLTALRREDGNQSFLFYFLKEFFDEENKIGSGTVFNSITKSVLNQLEMIGPPPGVIEEFESIVRPMDEQIRNNHKENQTLAETRDYLLPKLISGEIEVDAVKEVVGTEL